MWGDAYCLAERGTKASGSKYLPRSCGAVNKWSKRAWGRTGGKGSHGRAGDCSNYYTRSEFVGTVESVPIYLCPCATLGFTWKAVGGGDWYDVVVAIKKDNKYLHPQTKQYRGSKLVKWQTNHVAISQKMGAGFYTVKIWTGRSCCFSSFCSF